ncbi:hypothetical protein H8B15_08755 [Hymenobacter sp. BT507]|uniref:Outer membrane protein beta-barrel domain-containing protein n=1 Tax=Hymenobacter citatus TaxID=2763506 RepID=A0ABR7MIU8_9BACT|nr:hypothetical protein [Hymenobacter citatus]MBC6611011.1 hypothetical protein [Hymenobacter citatus]
MAPRFRTRSSWLAGLLLPAVAVAQPSLPDRHLNQPGPFFLTVQFAGGIGVVAVGGGYWLANRRVEPELLVGRVPRSLGGRGMTMFTLRTTYTPFAPQLGRGNWHMSPLSVGAQATYTTGKQFFLTNRSAGRYPKGYYWWSPKVRLGAFAGLRLTYQPDYDPRGWRPGRTTLYANLSTNDLHLVSHLTNRSLRLPEILTLGLGAKAGW